MLSYNRIRPNFSNVFHKHRNFLSIKKSLKKSCQNETNYFLALEKLERIYLQQQNQEEKGKNKKSLTT